MLRRKAREDFVHNYYKTQRARNKSTIEPGDRRVVSNITQDIMFSNNPKGSFSVRKNKKFHLDRISRKGSLSNSERMILPKHKRYVKKKHVLPNIYNLQHIMTFNEELERQKYQRKGKDFTYEIKYSYQKFTMCKESKP